MYIFGVVDDNIWGIAVTELMRYFPSTFREFIGYPFGYSYAFIPTNQPVYQYFYTLLSVLVGSVQGYNITVVVTLLLNLIFSYKLFRYFIKNFVVSLMLSGVFVFIPYFTLHLRAHPELAQFWTVCLFLKYFFVADKPKQFVKAGLLLTLVGLVSTYLLYFTLLFLGLYFISELILEAVVKSTRSAVFSQVKGLLLLCCVFLVTFTLAISPFIYSLTSGKDASTARLHKDGLELVGNSWQVDPTTTQDLASSEFIQGNKRPLVDYFTFSSRPWYFFLPPSENPVFGNMTKRVVSYLQYEKHYWLADNYFPSEHDASYLGVTNIVFALLGVFFFLYTGIHHASKKTYFNIKKNKQLLALLLTLPVLVLLTMPPYFTLSGHTLYMPTYILNQLIPFFRVTTRLAIYIHLILFIFVGIGYLAYINFVSVLLKKKLPKLHLRTQAHTNAYSLILILPFILLSLVEFFIPPTFVDVRKAPQIYSYIANTTDETDAYAVYPFSMTLTSLYWTRETKRPFVNPRGYSAPNFNYDSHEFTRRLAKCEGILEAKNIGVDYLVYFYTMDNKRMLDKLNTNPMLEKKAQFTEYGSAYLPGRVYNIVNASSANNYSSVLYKLNDVSFEDYRAYCPGVGTK